MSEFLKAPPISKAQREAILFRDKYTSAMLHYSEEKGFYQNTTCPYDHKPCSSLQVHHILPRGFGGENLPENLATIFECEHAGRCKDKRIR